MTKIQDVIAANQLLVSLGAEDQMPKLAAISIETVLDLRSRIERAISYANQAPPASAHARNMARILDGSITEEDEQLEAENEPGELPGIRRHELTGSKPKPQPKKGTRGKLKPGAGLAGRSTRERLEIRAWIAENGFDIAPSGRIPQKYLDAYDEYQAKIRQRAS